MSFSSGISDISVASSSCASSISSASSAPSAPGSPTLQGQRNTKIPSHPQFQTTPSHQTLTSLLATALDLARLAFHPLRHPASIHRSPTGRYLALHARATRFFTKWRGWDWRTDQEMLRRVMCLEILMELVVRVVGIAAGLDELGVVEDGEEVLKKRCYEEVEGWVFRGEGFDLGEKRGSDCEGSLVRVRV